MENFGKIIIRMPQGQGAGRNDSASLSLPLIRIRLDGGSGSGDWGHAGRPGKVGGSGGGGGKGNRTGTKETGFSSEAKKKAEEKKRSGGVPKGTFTKENGMERMKRIADDIGESSERTGNFVTADPEWKKAECSGAFYDSIGYNKLPRVASETEFDEMESDFPTLYRGVESKQQVDDFMHGKRYIGGGANGTGTNVSPDAGTAKNYSENGNIITMKLANDAKVIKDTELIGFVQEYRKGFSEEKGVLRHIASDPGVVAASLGYDAIEDTSTGWLNVMNRSKVVVKEIGDEKHGDATLLPKIRIIFEKPLTAGLAGATLTSQNADGGPGSGNFWHKGVPGQVGGSAPSGNAGNVTKFQRKGGKMEITSDVKVKADGRNVTLKAGTDVTKIVDFAGAGKKKPVGVEPHLISQYGGTKGSWKHTRGEAEVLDNGKSVKAELHWFESKDVGQVNLKVKRFMEDGDES